MAIVHQARKVGAHSNQDTRPYERQSSSPEVAPDSQVPTTGQKRKRRKRRRTSDSSWDQAERLYWDSLSRLWLAPDAIREFDRRNALVEANPHEICTFERQVLPRKIERFARHGGPDLSVNNLQPLTRDQYPDYSESITSSDSMPPTDERKSSGRNGLDEAEKTRRSSEYTPNFGQMLVDSGISLVSRGHRAANHEEWNEALIQPRPSLSPSRMSDGHYDRLVNAIEEADTRDEAMSKVFTKIVGESRYPSRQKTKLGNLDPIGDSLVVSQPDHYEGEPPGPGNRWLRKELEGSIVPSSHTHYPFMPNLFAEVESPHSRYAVSQRQARHDGALGARAMHQVENLGRNGEVFDDKARTASVIYSGGVLLAYSVIMFPSQGDLELLCRPI